MIKNRLRQFPLVLRLRDLGRAAIVQLRDMRRGFGRKVLAVGLIATYFLLITPIGVLRRLLLGRSLVDPATNLERGWRPINQSSADKRIYMNDY